MEKENIESLESLNFYCYLCGIITVFLGIVIIFMNVVDMAFANVQVGIFIFATGYAFVKISSKLTKILNIEKKKIMQKELEEQGEGIGELPSTEKSV